MMKRVVSSENYLVDSSKNNNHLLNTIKQKLELKPLKFLHIYIVKFYKEYNTKKQFLRIKILYIDVRKKENQNKEKSFLNLQSRETKSMKLIKDLIKKLSFYTLS